MGLLFSTARSRAQVGEAFAGFAASVPRDFLRMELDRSMRETENLPPTLDFLHDDANEDAPWFVSPEAAQQAALEAAIAAAVEASRAAPPAPSGPPPPAHHQAGNQRPPQLSPLVPHVEGRFASRPGQNPQGQGQQAAFASMPGNPAMDMMQMMAGMMPDHSALFASLGLNGEQNQNASPFFDASPGGAISGHFLQDNLLWIGTIIPAVLITAINTDLPGNVLARVTQNIYDSRTGASLLIPQGTILFARYNDSISFAQRRVQIVWDVLIRPDGFMVELEGMNGVDSRGMAGIRARYRENWFQYIQAGGLIAFFSVANATLADQIARFGSDEMVAAAVMGNAEFVRDIGGNMVSRAMDIQPTLTVESGEMINVMLSRNVHLPPVDTFPVTQRHVIPRGIGR